MIAYRHLELQMVEGLGKEIAGLQNQRFGAGAFQEAPDSELEDIACKKFLPKRPRTPDSRAD
jgi:hypothetical protein